MTEYYISPKESINDIKRLQQDAVERYQDTDEEKIKKVVQNKYNQLTKKENQEKNKSQEGYRKLWLKLQRDLKNIVLKMKNKSQHSYGIDFEIDSIELVVKSPILDLDIKKEIENYLIEKNFNYEIIFNQENKKSLLKVKIFISDKKDIERFNMLRTCFEKIISFIELN